ncbi:DNA-directed RNA polymerase subunit K [Pyrobaculum aerophilum]|nr:DNA-directed RNA polymerase subunit K [Pyrobaculum aerophilum]
MTTSELIERINKLIDVVDKAINKREFYPPRLTKYEAARIIGARALQLAMGAQPLVDIQEVGSTDPVLIAMEELRRGLLDFIIVREMPDGKTMRIRLKELLELERTL